MPALRLERDSFTYNPIKSKSSKAVAAPLQTREENKPENKEANTQTVDMDWMLAESKKIVYPTKEAERKTYRTPGGKAVSSHQWDVYDHILTIPCGKVSTYKDVSQAIGGSPRSVGNALRTNPFAPYIPCHRVIASNLFVGGFRGEWGHDHKTGTQCGEKLSYLAAEGVKFSKTGHLLDAETTVWKDPALALDEHASD